MQLNILTNREVGNSVGVAAREGGDGAQLMRSHHAVRNPDAHHEPLQSAAFPALPTRYARAVALGVNAPPAEISADPFRRDRVESFAGKAADLVQSFPRIFRPLEALGTLCLGFFGCRCRHRSEEHTSEL